MKILEELNYVTIKLVKQLNDEEWVFEYDDKRYIQNMKISSYSGFDFDSLQEGQMLNVHPWVVKDSSLA